MSARLPRTIVLGLDGLDARLVRVLMRAGLLPAMRRLATENGFREVISTTPAESAVAWTSFTRGENPGQTGVFDFVGRRLGSYLPYLVGTESRLIDALPSSGARWGMVATAGLLGLAGGYGAAHKLTRRQWLKRGVALGAAGALGVGVGVPVTQWRPKQVERIESTVAGDPWWERLARQGYQCTALRVPMAYPARAHPNVRLLAGLGVPDVLGTQGTYWVLSDRTEHAKGRTIPIRWEGNRAKVRLKGPVNPINPSDRSGVAIDLERVGEDGLRIGSGGRFQSVRRGEWSLPLRLVFRFSPLLARRAMTRFYFCETRDETRIYVAPLEFDPATELQENPISSPPGLARELCERVGDFSTIGWETQTAGLIAEVFDEAAYLEDAYRTLELNEAQLFSELQRKEWHQFMFVVQASDQISHMCLDDAAAMMRAGGEIDQDHPLVRLYRYLDELVGRVAKAAHAVQARLLVMSDHGFAPFRRSINLNTWLAHQGYLALKDRTHWDEPSADAILDGAIWSNVDWFNTRAFALGLGGIYLNVQGREPNGIVKMSGEYEFIQERLIRDLKAWRDPVTEKPVFANVYRRQDVYDGPHIGHAPDLILGLHENYRVSSSTVVGGIPEGVVHDNSSAWKADHCGVDAGFIPGICLTNFQTDWPNQLSIDLLSRRLWPGR